MSKDKISDLEQKMLDDLHLKRQEDGSLNHDWFNDYSCVTKTFASSDIPSWKMNPPTGLHNGPYGRSVPRMTKQRWYDAWRDMVTLCARALEYKDEAERRAKHLEDELQTGRQWRLDKLHKQIDESEDNYKKMVKSFDELGEKYTKDMDALMKLLLLLGRKIDD